MKKVNTNPAAIVVMSTVAYTSPEHPLLNKDIIEYAMSVASKYAGNGPFRDDIIQDAVCSIFDAEKKFDPSKGATFKTFATYYINKAISNSIARYYNSMSVPKALREEVKLLSLDATYINNVAGQGGLQDPEDEFIEGTAAENVVDEEDIRRRRIHEKADELLSILDPVDRQIVEEHFGFNGKDLSFKQIAQKMGLTPNNVRTRFNQAMGQLILEGAKR